jgi:hypothetical protein
VLLFIRVEGPAAYRVFLNYSSRKLSRPPALLSLSFFFPTHSQPTAYKHFLFIFPYYYRNPLSLPTTFKLLQPFFLRTCIHIYLHPPTLFKSNHARQNYHRSHRSSPQRVDRVCLPRRVWYCLRYRWCCLQL